MLTCSPCALHLYLDSVTLSSATGISLLNLSDALSELTWICWLPLARAAVSWSPPKRMGLSMSWCTYIGRVLWRVYGTKWFNLHLDFLSSWQNLISCVLLAWNILLQRSHYGNHVFILCLAFEKNSQWHLQCVGNWNSKIKNVKLIWPFPHLFILLMLNMPLNNITKGRLHKRNVFYYNNDNRLRVLGG